MNTTSTDSQSPREQAWAKPVDALRVGALSGEAVNLNVEGRRITGPVHGFGQMWLCRQQTAAIARTADNTVECGIAHGLDLAALN